MTREKAIDILKQLKPTNNTFGAYVIGEALTMAIESLEKQCCDRNVCIQNEYNGIGCDECITEGEDD